MSGHHRVPSGGSGGSGSGKHSRPSARRDEESSSEGGGGGGGGAAAGAGGALSAEERAALFEFTYAMPMARSEDAEHSWGHMDASKFNIRGHNYLVDGRKIPAGPAVFQVAHVTTFMCDKKVDRVAERADS